jgi:LEA14-like dessication related protein
MAVAAVMGAVSCETISQVFQEPKLSVKSVDLAGISFTGADLVCRVNVENPNGFSIPFPKIDWQLFVNTASFVKGSLGNGSDIKARNTVTVNVPFSVAYKDLFQVVSSLQGKTEAAYNIALGISFPKLPLIGDKIYELDFSGVLPVLHLPTVSFKGISVKTVSLQKLDFILNWEVENKNSFPLAIGKFNYDFKVNNSQWAQGLITNPPPIQPNGKTVIPLEISLSARSMVTEITSIITKGTGVAYSCVGDINLSAGLSGLKALDLPFNFTGSTALKR